MAERLIDNARLLRSGHCIASKSSLVGVLTESCIFAAASDRIQEGVVYIL